MSDESFKPRNPKKEHFTQEMISIYIIFKEGKIDYELY